MKTKNNKADKLWREAIKQRDKSCVVCGATQYLNAHHIAGRRNFRLRWELFNGISLCPKHHTFDSKFSAHQTPSLFGEWFIEHYPERHQFIKTHVNEMWDKDIEKVLSILEEVCRS